MDYKDFSIISVSVYDVNRIMRQWIKLHASQMNINSTEFVTQAILEKIERRNEGID